MKRKKKLNIIGASLIIIIIATIFYMNQKEKYIKKISKEQINIYFDRTSIIDEEKELPINNDPKEKYDYIAILEIPSIELLQGLLPISNKYNNVEYNIQIIEGSEMPNVPKTNLVLASHSGTSNISYFKNLDKLKPNDNVYIYYEGYKYTYKIDNYYILPKTGTISIDRNKYKNTITLITCKKDNDGEQIVYIGYLTTKEIY